MGYGKALLAGFTATVLAELVPSLWSVFSGTSSTKATGLAAVAGGFVESLISPLFWILAILIFASLFAASKLTNKPLRIFLFWIPTLTVCSLSVAVLALGAYLLIHFRNS